jgi:hypothetical protein
MEELIINIFITLIMLFISILILIIYKYYHKKIESFDNSNKICCLYAYYEKNQLYKDNFEYFLNNAILDNVDYYIIINGECSIQIPKKNNIIIFQRENIGYDFGAFSYSIQRINKNYDYYFFLNTSVIGPLWKDNYNNSIRDWTVPFLKLFNKDVVLVGTSINILTNNNIGTYNLKEIYGRDKPYSHVQSMFFCINNEYYNYLKKINFFNESEMNNAPKLLYIIAYKEIGLSQIAIKNGWNINSILSKYKDLDYRTITKNINLSSGSGDPYYEGRYFGDSIDKYEAIFYKNNRGF